MTKEIEAIGIPVAHITTLSNLALGVGSNRVIQGNGITNPAGDPALNKNREYMLRKNIVIKALESLTSSVEGPTIFDI